MPGPNLWSRHYQYAWLLFIVTIFQLTKLLNNQKRYNLLILLFLAFFLPVLASFHSSDRKVFDWIVYLEIGLWLSVPRLQVSATAVSLISSILIPPGGPGGPEEKKKVNNYRLIMQYYMSIDILISVLALILTQIWVNFVRAKINWAKAEVVTVSLKPSQNLPTTRISNSMPWQGVEFTTHEPS